MSVAFAPVELCSGASDLGQDVLGLGRPNGGLRFFVVLEKILLQRGDQLRQAVEDPTPHARDGEIAKKRSAMLSREALVGVKSGWKR
jgi:hypothetical protein